jgi:glycosyltransferase involved in cell wall biosynthesis
MMQPGMNMTGGLVSICIPTYNGAQFLTQCLESACAQTWPELEILVVDDQSSDDTVALAELAAARDPRVRVVRNPRNLGLVGNWNRCIELARGEWVKFLFQDDWLEPECVSQMLAVADRPLVFCRRDFVFEGSHIGSVAGYLRHMEELSLAGVFGAGSSVSAEQVRAAVMRYPDKNIFGEPTSCMIHRSAFDRYGLYDARLVQLCDVEFAARVGTQAGLSYQHANLAHFRVHGASTTATNQRIGAFRKDIIDSLLIAYAQGFEPAYGPLRETAEAAGVDLPGRFGQQQLHEQLWGSHWHVPDWAGITRTYPFLRLPFSWRAKRAVRRVLRAVTPQRAS